MRPPREHQLFVWTNNAVAVAAEHSVDVDRWNEEFACLVDQIESRFTRYEPLRHAVDLILGLLSNLETKNCWSIAEHRGHTSPDALQHLLARAVWDADAVRDDLRGYVIDHLADQDAVLVFDETGDLKKGTHSVGVQRQYTGTAGRIENSQVAVYLTYAAPAGHAFIDRALYLPKSWTDDRDRCSRAGVPQEVGFATKPALAVQMLDRAMTASVPARWVTGDEVYGADPLLRKAIRGRGLGYVLAIAANRALPATAGTARADEFVAALPQRAWRRLSPGAGSKGQRWYSWVRIELLPEHHDTGGGDGDDEHSRGIDGSDGSDGSGDRGVHSLLVRRNDTTGELAYYRCYSPTPVPLHTLVQVAGQRWRIEESFQASKTLVGLDQHQVRRWTSWHRWTTLAMLAHAFLTVATLNQRRAAPAPDGLIELTLHEFRRLFTAFLTTTRTSITSLLAWSRWRRRHQARARDSHYRRREHQ